MGLPRLLACSLAYSTLALLQRWAAEVLGAELAVPTNPIVLALQGAFLSTRSQIRGLSQRGAERRASQKPAKTTYRSSTPHCVRINVPSNLRTAPGPAGTTRHNACPAAASCLNNSAVRSQSIFRLDASFVLGGLHRLAACILPRPTPGTARPDLWFMCVPLGRCRGLTCAGLARELAPFSMLDKSHSPGPSSLPLAKPKEHAHRSLTGTRSHFEGGTVRTFYPGLLCRSR